jgi:hypothetical protein
MIGSGYANDDTHDRVAVILTRVARRKFPMACRCRRVFSRNHGGSGSDGVHSANEKENAASRTMTRLLPVMKKTR